MRWNISVTKFQNSKIWDDNFVGFSVGFVRVYSIFLSAQFSWRNLQNKMASFWRFWKNWKKPNFAAKNLCDKVSKIKNLRWQFCGIFRRLCHGLLCFFCRRCFHGEICKIKWPLLELISAVISRSFSLRNLRVTYD